MTDDLVHLAGIAAIAIAGVAALASIAILVVRALRAREAEATQAQLADLARLQAESTARMHTLGELLAGRQSELARAVNERLDAVTHRLGMSMQSSHQHTVDHLAKLNERLAVIDSAQKNLTDLASQVTSLREVLANKQLRGAFGQARMEAIVADALPKSAYAFQFTLANGKRPDCAVFLPDGRPLVIDAKFPLEAVAALREARGEDARKAAAARVRQDVIRHVNDIAEKYLIAGETQDTALMFVPSESVYAELHDGFDDLVQKAYRARVVLVSPALLMLAIQVIQQIQKDARMREAADRIRNEVGAMMEDVDRLRDRVVKLERHFGQANEDIRQILISADKIEKRAGRIEELEFDDSEGGGAGAPAEPVARVTAGPVPLALKLAGE